MDGINEKRFVYLLDENLELLEEEKIDEMFRYLEIYKDSLGEEEEIADAEDLLRYYENNREGLLPYRSQGLELPEPPEGLEHPVFEETPVILCYTPNWADGYMWKREGASLVMVNYKF